MTKLEVWIDGACEPINPGGTASYGVVIKNDEVTVFADSAIVGSGYCSNWNRRGYWNEARRHC